MFGALSAVGDATGGSSSNDETATGMNDPDEEPHPPLDKLKAKRRGEAVLGASRDYRERGQGNQWRIKDHQRGGGGGQCGGG